MRLARTTLIHFISQVGTSIVGFIATLYFARVLGADVLGKYFVVVALVTWLMIPADGFSSAIRKRVSEGDEPAKFFSSGLFFNIGFTTFLVVSIFLFNDYVNTYVGAKVAPIVALLVVGNVLFLSMEDGLKGQKKVAEAGILGTIERVLRAGLQVIFIYLSYQLSALILGHVIALLITTAVGFLMYDFRVHIPDKRQVVSIIKFARYSWLGGFKRKSFNWIDVLILNVFVASSLVGVYEISWNIASVFTLISSSIQSTLFPEISDISADDEFAKVKELLNDGLAFAGIFIIPGFFGALILGQEVLRIYGSEFTQGYYILLVLIIARWIAVYEGVFNQTLNAINRPDLAFRMNVSFVILNLVFNVFLIYWFGWIGAAVATSMSSGISLFLGYYFFTNTRLGSPVIPWQVIGEQIFSGIVMAMLVIGVQNFIPWQSRLVTVALVFFGATCYMIVLMAISKRVRSQMFSMIPY